MPLSRCIVTLSTIALSCIQCNVSRETRPRVILTLSDHLHHLHMFCDGQRLLLICHQSTHPLEALGLSFQKKHKKGKTNVKTTQERKEKCQKNKTKEREILKKKKQEREENCQKNCQEREEKTQEMEDTEIGAAVNCTRRNHTYHHSKLITSFKNSHPRKIILQIL